MNSRRWPVFWLMMLVSLVAATFALPLGVRAQAVSQVVINYIDAQDDPANGGVNLKIYFTLTDAAKKVITNAQLEKATFRLDPEDGGSYEAKVERASGPISIILALDSSGSMSTIIKTIQQAAIKVVSDAPEKSRFAVVRIGDRAELVQDFTDDKNRVINSIGQIKAGGNTCLFDAAYLSVETLAKDTATKGRRAVILFTDGMDETLTPNKPCSTKTVPEVITLATARDTRAPIYSIGLRARRPIAEAELRNMAEATGGAIAIGSDPAELFKEIQDALNAQFVAEALVGPRQGERNMALRITIGGASPNDATGRFFSPADYSVKPTATPTVTLTPLPVDVVINSVQQDFASKQFIVDMSVVSEQLVKEYRFILINSSGTTAAEDLKPAPLGGPARIRMPDPFVPGEYRLRVTAIGKEGQILDRSDEVSLKYEVTPTPSPSPTATIVPASVKIDSINYKDAVAKAEVVVKLSYVGQEQIARLSAIVSNASTNITEKTFDPLQVAPELTLNIAGIPSEKYNVIVTAYGSGGQQISQSSIEFTHTFVPPTPTPTATPEPQDFIYRVGKAIRDPQSSPFVFGVFGAIVLGLVALMAVLFLRRPKKAATGTNFLREMTGAVDISQLEGYKQAQQGQQAQSAPRPSAPAAAPSAASRATDYDRTAAVSFGELPIASLTVEKSRETSAMGKVVQISHLPFTLGRRERDLNFENDGGVSRDHAEITFENNVFFIKDKGSTNHTFVDEVDIGTNTPKPLYDGAAIRLGTSTVLRFRLEQKGGFDSDKTMPEPFKLN